MAQSSSRVPARARPAKDRTTLYEEITSKIIAELEVGRLPWVQPWGSSGVRAPLGLPKNAATGRAYSGINVLILWSAGVENGFTVQSWVTFKQAVALGGPVRKGERGTIVVYADRFIPDDVRGRAHERGEEPRAIPFLKRFTVFNAEQCQGLPDSIAALSPPVDTSRLADNAEAVCREYLSNGQREGGTWRVGDIDNTPGRSLMVRLTGPDSGPGAAGHWIDFASGQHGDLLDLIAHTCRHHAFRDVLEEARRFLSLPQQHHAAKPKRPTVPSGSPEAAQRLFASATPIPGTLAAIYLRSRGITDVHDLTALRFHPTCFYRAHEGAPRESWPALLAAVTDLDGAIAGVLRTWLARDGSGKAPLATPRRSLGRLLGSGVRFGNRPCENCFPFPESALDRVWSASMRQFEHIFVVPRQESTPIDPGAILSDLVSR